MHTIQEGEQTHFIDSTYQTKDGTITREIKHVCPSITILYMYS